MKKQYETLKIDFENLTQDDIILTSDNIGAWKWDANMFEGEV